MYILFSPVVYSAGAIAHQVHIPLCNIYEPPTKQFGPDRYVRNVVCLEKSFNSNQMVRQFLKSGSAVESRLVLHQLLHVVFLSEQCRTSTVLDGARLLITRR